MYLKIKLFVGEVTTVVVRSEKEVLPSTSSDLTKTNDDNYDLTKAGQTCSEKPTNEAKTLENSKDKENQSAGVADVGASLILIKGALDPSKL